MALPATGPDGLGAAGVSMADYYRMRNAWLRGLLTYEEIETTHGNWVKEVLRKRWGSNNSDDGGAESEPCRLPADPRNVGNDKDPHQTTERRGDRDREETEEETDETVHMSLVTSIQLVAAHHFTAALAMDDMPLIHRIARDQLGRLRREGWTKQQQASALFVLVQDRHCPEYIQRFPWLLADLGLELDVNLAPSCLPAPGPVLTWLEAELWDLFLDWYEATVGAETDGLQRLRERPTMSNAEMEQWRTWATSGTTSTRHTRTRSRSPRREAGPTVAGGDEEQLGDETSLMHRGGRGNSWGDSGHESRGRRRSRHRRRSRSRNRYGSAAAEPSNREARIRQRITGETRHLVPRCRENSTNRWAAESPPGGAAGSHVNTSRRAVPSSVNSEMDLLEATGRWLRLTGLRREGEEGASPAMHS